MLERLLQTVSEATGQDHVVESSRFGAALIQEHALNLDSLDFIFVMNAVEKEFSVEIPESDLAAMEKVSDVLKWLEANCR